MSRTTKPERLLIGTIALGWLSTCLVFVLAGCTPATPEPEPRVWTQSEQARANNKCLAYYEDEFGPGGAFDRCSAQLDTDLDQYMSDWLLLGVEG